LKCPFTVGFECPLTLEPGDGQTFGTSGTYLLDYVTDSKIIITYQNQPPAGTVISIR